MPVEIFCCYARKDQALLEELNTHLVSLQRLGIINIWADRNIEAGAEWEREIKKHLNTADIILLLISPDFMKSEYCYSVEMQRAMERHRRGEACVIPVILRPVYWERTPFGKLQALPTGAKPVTDPSWTSHDIAFYNVAEGVRKTIEQLTTKSMTNQITASPEAHKNPIKKTFATFSAASNQRNRFVEALDESLLSNSSSLFSSSSAVNQLGKWIKQGRNLFLIVCVLDITFLLLSFFLSPNSLIPDSAIFVAAAIFIFSLIESALLQQWYWFVGILLLNPLTGFIYYQIEPASFAIKWYWFVGSILLCPLIGACYSLFGPKMKRHNSFTNTAFKQLILTTSFIGIIVFIIAMALNSLWAIYIGCDFYVVGYILAIIQIVRLKQGYWLEDNILVFLFLLIPILFFGIVYALFSPKVGED